MAAAAEALARRGVPTHFVFSRLPCPAVEADLARAGASFEAIDFAAPTAPDRVRAVARVLAPAIVHLHFVRPLSPIARAAASPGARLVVNEHLALALPQAGALPAL